MSSAIELRAVKDLVRNPFAWPGGYPKFLLMADGECLCHRCAKSEFRHIVRAAMVGEHNDGWKPAAVDINWEDASMSCAHCNQAIESAYGASDADIREDLRDQIANSGDC